MEDNAFYLEITDMIARIDEVLYLYGDVPEHSFRLHELVDMRRRLKVMRDSM